jgi:Major tropism determinant N-terminal domain
MAVQVKRRRDTAANIAAFTPAQGEIIVDTTNNRMIVGDGATAGGFPAAKLSGDTFTGNVRAPNLSQTFPLQFSGSVYWMHLGTFTPSAIGAGTHLLLKVADSLGFNATAGQERETFVHFQCSNGSSVDANGFAGWTSFYSTNTEASLSQVAVVSNAAGNAATAFDIWFNPNGAYGGLGLYSVELPSGATWTHIGVQSATSPGTSGTSTFQLGVGSFNVQSPAVFGNGLTVGGAFAATGNLSQVAQGANGGAIQFQVIEQTVTLSGASTVASVPIPANCIVMACGMRVLTAVTGAPSFGVGDQSSQGDSGASAIRFGGVLNIAAGSTNYGIVGPFGNYAATDLLITATSGSFTGGVVRLSLKIMLVSPPTS